MRPVPGAPFGIAVTPDGRWAFTAVGGKIEVLRTGRSLAPVPVRTISVPGAALGETMTRDGRYLLAADDSGAVVISVARAEHGTSGAVLGVLARPTKSGSGGSAGLSSAIEVATSPDGQFAFVTLEYSDETVVFDLSKALASGFDAADYVGHIPLGEAAVGMAVSPDGRWLYATSEIGVPAQHAVGLGASTSATTGGAGTSRKAACPGTEPGEAPGTLSLIDLRRAETDPTHSRGGHRGRGIPAGARRHVGRRDAGLGDGAGQRRSALLLGGAARLLPRACARWPSSGSARRR